MRATQARLGTTCRPARLSRKEIFKPEASDGLFSNNWLGISGNGFASQGIVAGRGRYDNSNAERPGPGGACRDLSRLRFWYGVSRSARFGHSATSLLVLHVEAAKEQYLIFL